MPRIISVMRKYLPALSRELSLLSCHLSFRGRRNPGGGGPAGVAEQDGEDENAAALEMVEGRNVREISTALSGLEAGNVRVYMVKDLLGNYTLSLERTKESRTVAATSIADLAVSG